MSTVQVVPNLTFAVIGDSSAFGTGDEAPDGTFRGWAFYLAKSFRDECNYVNFARPGAKSDEVSGVQLNNAKGNYATSNEMILDKFRNEFAEVADATLGKAYLILAKNLFELKNLAQAKATIKSIIDNSEDKESVDAAKTLMKTYFPK